MARRRRYGLDIPGVRIGGIIRGNQYPIEREPDSFIVNNRRVRGGNIGIPGSRTNITINTGRPRRREAGRPNIDFEARRREIAEAIGRRAKQIAGLANMPAITFEEAAQREQIIHAGTGKKALTKIVDFQGEQRLITEKATAMANEKIADLEMRFGRQLNEAERTAIQRGELEKVRGSLMTNAFSGETHPIKNVLGRNKEGKRRRDRWKNWNPFDFVNAWFWHPLRTAGMLLPVKSKPLGLGRDSKGRQVASVRREALKNSGAFASIGGEARAIGIFTQYRERMSNAFEEFQRTGNSIVFERAVKDAESWAQSQISGQGGLISDYVAARKAT